jgi:3-hydroxyisobutyrate dehydrogenase-like beta-hydroxyacid dehydrogenase
VEIGLIGLGNMGSGIAKSLLRAGHKLTVYNRTRSRAEVLEGQRTLVAGSIAEACRREAVLTTLADDRALESVVFGEDGILASLPRRGSHLCFEYDQRGAE